MARSLVFGNGRLHVGLDENSLVHDIYFPHVGLESHIAPNGPAHKVGVFVDGQMSWLDDGSWVVAASFHEKAMVGETIATNEKLGVRLELTDGVAHDADMFVRLIHVINTSENQREVKLFCHQAFAIADSQTSDSAQYRPDLPGIMHYKGDRVFVASLRQGDEYFSDYSVGKYSPDGEGGTYRDAEDGLLEKNLVENGRTDSVVGVSCVVEPYGSKRFSYVLCAATSSAQVEDLFEKFADNDPVHFLAETARYTSEWLSVSSGVLQHLPDNYRKAAERSLLVIKAHLDSHGAVMASLDSGLRNHPQDDAYNFCWPRDAMYSLWPLLRLGYRDELLGFFEFARRGLHPDGYLYHKYRADGSLGSTWLPYSHPDGSVHPPVQVDETAGVLFLVGQYFRQTNDQKFVVDFYETLVEPMANFLAGYVDENGLPLPSYDLWEHSYLTHTYTTALTYSSLLEAAELASAYGRQDDATRWTAAAGAMKAQSGRFYNPEKQYFYRGLDEFSGDKKHDDTVDVASLYGAFMYGLFDIESSEVLAAITTARERLSDGPLYARFEGDDYYAGDVSKLNLWPNTSLWMSEIFLERDELENAENIILAVLELAGPSGLLPEQVDRLSHQPTSLSPLVWSHAELVGALVDFIQTNRG